MYHQTSTTAKPTTKRKANRAATASLMDRQYCLNESCLSDEVSVRKVSSFSNVWLVTDITDNTSWLMNMETPVCPCCGSNLRSTMRPQRLPC